MVESLGKVCCGPANPREAQITAAWPTPAELCSALFSILKGKRARSAGSAAASPTPGKDPAATTIAAAGPEVANIYTSISVPMHIYLQLHIKYLYEYIPYELYTYIYMS